MSYRGCVADIFIVAFDRIAISSGGDVIAIF